MNTKLRLLLLALGAVALIAAGCGDDEDSGDSGDSSQASVLASAEKLTITATGPDEFKAPESAETGLTQITFVNNSDKPQGLQMARVEGDHSAAEVAEVIKSAMRGGPLPDWFFLGGGVTETPAGKSATVFQVLDPGTYYEVGEAPDSGVPIEVAGEESDDELPEGTATVTASEYTFTAEGLEKGTNEVLFENVGAQPHHLLAFPIKQGSTIEDIRNFIEQGNQGPPPIDEAAGDDTAILEGGDSQVVQLELKKSGTYALLCFISDREGGPPHVAKGMIGSVEIP
jgi:hypothetical protein